MTDPSKPSSMHVVSSLIVRATIETNGSSAVVIFIPTTKMQYKMCNILRWIDDEAPFRYQKYNIGDEVYEKPDLDQK
jgi:hypothetical protein